MSRQTTTGDHPRTPELRSALLGPFTGLVVLGLACASPHGEGTPSETDGATATGESAEPTGGPWESDTDQGQAVCGNGLVEADEDCEGADLAGASCASLGYATGTLACAPDCAFDPRDCSTVPEVPALMLSLSPIKQFELGWSPAPGAQFYELEQSVAPGEPFVPLGRGVLGPPVSHTMPLHLRHQASIRLLACTLVGCTASTPVDVMGSLAEAVGYLKASNPDAGDGFGVRVAISGDGSTLAVSASNEASSAAGVDGEQSDDAAPGAGAVYVFVHDERGTWSQQAYLKASNPGQADGFGHSVALSKDGSTLVVGAVGESSDGIGIDGGQHDDALPDSGAAYVFVRNALGAWSQQAYLKASNPGELDAFGHDVALSADGDTLAVSAVLEDSHATGIDGNQANDAAPSSGAVYVLVRDDLGEWSQQAYVKASNPDAHDRFGWSVALSDDGDTLAASAIGESSHATGIDGDQGDDSAAESGAVYVLVRDDAGSWSQQAYVKASDPDPGDQFGYDVALGEHGNTLAVGAFFEDGDDDSISGSGAVYVLVRDELGRWSQQAYAKASNPDPSDAFGRSVALSADGRTLAVGASFEDSSAVGIGGQRADDTAPDSGAVYVLVRDGMGTWSQRAYVKAPNPDPDDRFGSSVALSGDAHTLAVGAWLEDGGATGIGGDQTDDAAPDSGAVYLY